MSALEQHFDHAPEQIPAFTRGFVKFISVDEFLQLRFQRWPCSDAEERQLLDAADAVREFAGEKGKTYRLGDEIKSSHDLRVIIARRIVPHIPLQQYLATRHKVLDASIAGITRLRDEYASFIGCEEELEKVNIMLIRLFADLNLTNKVTAVTMHGSSKV
jgi:hypothetical protein